MNREEKPVFFYFTKKERIGILVILMINALLLSIPSVYRHFYKKENDMPTNLLKDSIYITKNNSQGFEERDGSYDVKRNNEHHELFMFNPNTLNADGLRRLGISEKTIHTILNYRKKGGVFHQPEDLYKIWGMPAEKANELIGYVQLSEQNKSAGKADHSNKFESSGQSVFKEKKRLDINFADSADFEQLPGIGPVLSKRIVAYRKKLGGFISLQQLHEVWGLQDSIFQKIQDRLEFKQKSVEKKDINHADFEALRAHPYIGYQLAKLIVNYRKQHGNLSSLEDIQSIIPLNEIQYNHISQYFFVNN